ncbi:hypothetical protein SAMN06272735_5950 [Streptomyces sp. TLI_55]|uniref:hypothetical protein n=1 Tax=Streptomyces sp. TLI_55 TaxID=1938861 RepID=UPI000BCC0F79|nr:hypothetical protein [Streptomyces sp. TLI_55]SNX64135.1 hypothetical protein SAMN06272735_5950 [Streptomyces sp. TLI_55]
MRTTTAGRAVRTAAVAAGAVLVTGCGSETSPSAEASTAATSPAAFGQKTVRADLDAALEAAGLPEGETEMGYPGAGHPAGQRSAAERRKLAALAERLSPCVVSWKSTEPRRQLDLVLSGLEARGWKKGEPYTEAPMTGSSTYFLATYKKQGWTLGVRHISTETQDRSKVMATEDTCFAQVTDEELDLVEAQ